MTKAHVARDDALRHEKRRASTLPGADSVGTEKSGGSEIRTPKSHRWLDMLDSPYTEAEVGAFSCSSEFSPVKHGSLLLGSPSNYSEAEFWRSRNSNEREERQERESKLDGQGDKDRLGRIEVVWKGAEGDRIQKEFERNRERKWRQERELERGEVKAKAKELEISFEVTAVRHLLSLISEGWMLARDVEQDVPCNEVGCCGNGDKGGGAAVVCFADVVGERRGKGCGWWIQGNVNEWHSHADGETAMMRQAVMEKYRWWQWTRPKLQQNSRQEDTQGLQQLSGG